MTIRKTRDLNAALGDDVSLGQGGAALHSEKYILLPIDLRSSPSHGSPFNLTSLQQYLDTTLPTLLLFECVLVYMPPVASQRVIQWFVDLFHETAPLSSIVYEMFGLSDSFGKVMQNNLKVRRIDLPGAEPYQTASSLTNRFEALGFSQATARTLKEIRNSYIAEGELSRISQLEMLDEVEELDLVLAHYAVTWGVKFPTGYPHEQSWKQWDLVGKAVAEQ